MIKLPAPVYPWTDIYWPELAKAGGLASVEYEVVDHLPFRAKAHAMTWRGRVLLRREWIAPALGDMDGNTINPRHLWAIETMAFHEPYHVIEQRKMPWRSYLLRYIWQWIRGGFSYRNIQEEIEAYAQERKLADIWFKWRAPLTGLRSRPNW